MVVTIAVWVIVAVWLTLLTVGLLRRREEPGEPVYRRLPDGRLRFERSVHTACRSARHELAALNDPGPAGAPHRAGPGSPTPRPDHDPVSLTEPIDVTPQRGGDDR